MILTDFEAMQAALALAQQAQNDTPPNPAVGCVLRAPDQRVIGRGQTQPVGGPHAEVMALRQALALGASLRGASACVTLEPCSHQGRTPPCASALIEAGIARVQVATLDPNPLVAGRGLALLRAAGILVELLAPQHPQARAARELNIGFFSRMLRGRPWVRLKVAATLDGKIALTNGVSQWITSPEARTDGHAWRARAGAILTGIGTLLQDRPRLDVRLASSRRQPMLVVVDSRLRSPPDAPIFIAPRAVLICTTGQNDDKKAALQARGAEILCLPAADSAGGSRVDLPALLHQLGQRGVNELHVEAGARLSGALLAASLADELLLYLAPKLVGPGLDLAAFGPLTDLSQALALDWVSVDRIGPDLRLVARLKGHEDFLHAPAVSQTA